MNPLEQYRPQPDLEFEAPTPWPVRISHAVRDLREGFAFVRAAYRKHRPSSVEITMLTEALNDGFRGGHTVEDASFTWEAPVYLPAAKGKSRKTKEPHHYTAFVQKRGPHFYDTRQA